ncbi:MAG: hypothetical protein DHS20C11_28090 [Lysobacteraceae bacterium]|nr:MAG: hypothetical protein DHS20C11_28090 [Xanthomonadaceae bacterium]
MRSVVISLLLTVLLNAPVAAEPLTLTNTKTSIEINSDGAITWKSCHAVCGSSNWQNLFEEQTLGVLGADGYWQQLSTTTVQYRSATDHSMIRQYQLDQQGFTLTVTGTVDPSLQLIASKAMHPKGHEGFAGLGDELRIWKLVDHTVEVSEQGQSINLTAQWSGVRNRFWTIAGKGNPGHLELYGGPIAPAALKALDPALSKLFLNSMWPGARQLSLGMKWLLDKAYALTASWGLAIILMSLMVKLLTSPLSRLAQRLQDQVNQTKSMLQPMIAQIRAESRGEEQVNRLNALYKEHGVSPLYAFKSLTGLLIQIPIFIAAYHLLHEHAGLNGVEFLWIQNLALPDHAISLPFTIPFFGGWINALPLLMTVLTIITARLHQDQTLTPDLAIAQQRQLYLMALAFLLLFYTFPAGMVLYWTTNNAVEAVKSLRFVLRK